MVNIRFVFTDAKENFLITREVLDGLNIADVAVTYNYISNNSESLPTVFNRELDYIRANGNDVDFLAFIHGDVLFDIPEFITRLIATSGKYDLVGLAGTKKMDTSHTPLNWFTSSHNYQDQRYGDITMNETATSTKRCFYNEFHHPNVKDTEVACIDGLCIVMNKKMLNSDIRFLEGLQFNCYDTFISLESILNYHFKVGVMVIPTKHLSVGRSILSDVFIQEENIMRNYLKLNR